MLKIAHTLGQRLHFAQALVHLLEPVGDLLETLAQPRFQRGLQFFVNRLAHFIELGRIGLLQLRQLLFQRFPHFTHAACIRLTDRLQLRAQGVRQGFLQQRELLRERINLRVLRTDGLGTLLHQRLLEGRQGACQFLPAATRVFADLAPQFALHLVIAGGHAGQQFGAAGVSRFSQQQPDQQQQDDQQQAGQQPEFHQSHNFFATYLIANTAGFKGVGGFLS